MRFLTATDKNLWRLALPMIISNITVPLLVLVGVVDTAVIGYLDSPVYLGGVAVGTTVTSFLFMLLLFICLRYPVTALATHLIGGDLKVLQQAALFIQIRWLSAPATLANLVILGWLLGVQ